MRRLSILGSALTLATALCLLASQPVSASVTLPPEGAIYKGTSEDTQIFKITPEGPEVKCTHAQIEGTVLGQASDSMELVPTYTPGSCTASFGTAVHVDFAGGGCAYLLSLKEAGTKADPTLKCAAGKSISITPTVFGSSVCTIHIPAQVAGGAVDLANYGEQELTIQSTVTSVDSTRTGSSLCGPAESTTGSYSGSAVLVSKTKLCKEEPKPTCNDFYKQGTVISGKAEETGYEISFSFRESMWGAHKFGIKCGVSKVSAETDAEVGNLVLPLKSVSMTFDKCKSEGKNTDCTVVMKNAPTDGGIVTNRFLTFGGRFVIYEMVLEFECKGEYKCEFTGPDKKLILWSPQPVLYGGKPAKLVFSEWLGLTADVENCHGYALVSGDVKVVGPPEGIWVVPA